MECTYFKKTGSYNNLKSITYSGTDHVQGRYVVAYMKTTPTSNDANFVVAFAEHWPGGTYKSALNTQNYATPAITSQQYKIGNSYFAVITYNYGAKFLGYAIQ